MGQNPPPLPTHRTSSSPVPPPQVLSPAPTDSGQSSMPELPQDSEWARKASLGSTERKEDLEAVASGGPRRRATIAGGSRLQAVASHYSDKDDLDFDWGSSSMGAEPGIDAHKARFSHMDSDVIVYVIDWSPERVKERRFTGDAFLRWFGTDGKAGQRPEWAQARWINVDGLNWEVIKSIALRFDLHPLALEDAIKFAAHSNSKADWYSSQLFVRLLIHSICTTPPTKGAHSASHSFLEMIGMSKYQRHARDVLGGDHEKAGTFASGAGDDDPHHAHGEELDAFDDDDDDDDVTLGGGSDRDEKLEEQLAAKSVVNHLTENYRVRIDRQQLSSFLLPSNTLISIFTHSGDKLTRAIIKRLHTPGTILRMTSDASMLLQALIDVVVDDALAISEEFRRELDVLEGRALVNPDITAVRHLHVLAGQLLMLKRQMTPLQGLILSLRNDDDARSSVAKKGSTLHARADDDRKGYLSQEARIYLTDIQDHIDSVLSSLELFSNLASSIVDFIFNSLSFSSNESQKYLTMISIIFLPLGFLTGYYGMNFSIFPEIGVFPDGTGPYGPNQDGGIGYFWKITGPLLAVLFALIVIANFGSTFVGYGRRAMHRVERHKHHRILKQRRRQGRGRKRS